MIVVCDRCSCERTPLEQPSGAASLPSKGDFWLCPQCGALYRFTGGMTIDPVRCLITAIHVRPASDDELAELEEARALDAEGEARRDPGGGPLVSSPLIYVASSWKNAAKLDAVHAALERQGLRTWDFRKNGFWWQDVDPQFLTHAIHFPLAPESRRAFEFDKQGLDACSGLFVVQPAGISTALEAGYVAGQGKPVVSWGMPREERMDIMWSLATFILGDDLVSVDEAAARMRGEIEELNAVQPDGVFPPRPPGLERAAPLEETDPILRTEPQHWRRR